MRPYLTHWLPAALRRATVLCLWLTWLTCPPAFAQVNGTGQALGVIQGAVLDSLDHQPLEYVTVAVQHARFDRILNGTITDEEGRFRISGLAPGQYRLRISYVGYADKTVTGVTIAEDQLITDAGNIALGQGVTLATVEVTSERAQIENKPDKLVYNLSADGAAGYPTLNDLLRKVPMVQVDAEGNVSLRGSRNIQVLIDGKPSGMFAAGVADALRMIPPEQVDRVEVITMPSARYDAEGAGGIINIITKRNRVEGYNGTLSLNGGNFLSRGNANLNLRGQRHGWRLMTGFNRMFHREVVNTMERIDRTASPVPQLYQDGRLDIRNLGLNASLGWDYDPSDFHSFSTNIWWGRKHTQADGGVDVRWPSGLTDQTDSRRDISNQKYQHQFSWTTDYRRLFADPDNEWNTSVQVANYINDDDYLQQETGGTDRRELDHNDGDTWEITLQTDYVHAVNDRLRLETGGKWIQRYILSDVLYYDYDFASDEYLISPEQSYDFRYQQQVGAAYLEATQTLRERWTLRLGLRAEYTANQIMATASENVHDDYTNLVPTLALNYSLPKMGNLGFSYARRIQRPGLAHLNPFVNRMDPYLLREGNPYLRPELADVLTLTVSSPFTKGFFNGSIYYYYTRDIIERFIHPLAEGVSRATYENIGLNHLLGSSVFLNYNLSSSVALRSGFNIFYYGLGQSELLGANANEGIRYNGFGMISYSRGDWKAEAMLGYVSVGITAQGRQPDMLTTQFSVSRKIFERGNLALSATNPFRREVYYGNTLDTPTLFLEQRTAVPFRMVNLAFRYSFGQQTPLRRSPEKRSVQNEDVKEVEEQFQ